MFIPYATDFGAMFATVRCIAEEALSEGDLVNVGGSATDALPYVEVVDALTDQGLLGVALNKATAKGQEVLVLLAGPHVRFRTTAYTGTTNKPKIFGTYACRIASMNVDADDSTNNNKTNYIRASVVGSIPAAQSPSGSEEYVVILHAAWSDATGA